MLHEKRDISLQTNCDMLCYKVICILFKPSFVTCPNASKDLLSRLHVPYLRNSTTLKVVCMEIWPWKITGFQFIYMQLATFSCLIQRKFQYFRFSLFLFGAHFENAMQLRLAKLWIEFWCLNEISMRIVDLLSL